MIAEADLWIKRIGLATLALAAWGATGPSVRGEPVWFGSALLTVLFGWISVVCVWGARAARRYEPSYIDALGEVMIVRLVPWVAGALALLCAFATLTLPWTIVP